MKNYWMIVGMLTLALSACQKDEEPVDRDYTTAVDQFRAESLFNDLLVQADASADDNGLRLGQNSCLDTVIIDTTNTPHTMLIDFGPVNCVGNDGRSRRGRILVSFTGRYRDPGTVITIMPVDFFLNDYGLQGSKTVTNMGLNSDGQSHFNIEVDGTVTAPDGSWTSSHQAQRTRTWVEGEGSLNWLDDVYEITGTGSGVNRNGLPYTAAIITPLRVELNCPWIVSGSFTVTPDNLPTRTVDFGNGACDNNGSVSVNGYTFYFGGP